MLFYFLLLPVALARAPGGPWDVFNYAPKSKTVYARDVYKSVGSVSGAINLVGNTGGVTLSPSSWITLDFGIEARKFPCFTRIQGSKILSRSEVLFPSTLTK